jgi:hypothetical protein
MMRHNLLYRAWTKRGSYCKGKKVNTPGKRIGRSKNIARLPTEFLDTTQTRQSCIEDDENEYLSLDEEEEEEDPLDYLILVITCFSLILVKITPVTRIIWLIL